MRKMVRVEGDEIQSGIRDVTLAEYDEAVTDFQNQEEEKTPKGLDKMEEDTPSTSNTTPSSLFVNPPSAPEPSLMPNFVELAAEDDAAPKFSSNEQLSSIKKLERAEKDEKTLEKLKHGVRPGEFVRNFTQLNKVADNRGKGNCADFISALTEFCDGMKNIDTGLFATPESVICHFKKYFLIT